MWVAAQVIAWIIVHLILTMMVNTVNQRKKEGFTVTFAIPADVEKLSTHVASKGATKATVFLNVY